jgi:hypothetical protein
VLLWEAVVRQDLQDLQDLQDAYPVNLENPVNPVQLFSTGFSYCIKCHHVEVRVQIVGLIANESRENTGELVV